LTLFASQDVIINWHPRRRIRSRAPTIFQICIHTRGASFESLEAAKDALLRYTVARGLSYKVLRSDKKRSRYIVSCSSSPADPNHLIRLKCFRRRQDNGRSTAQLPSGYTFELAASKLGQIPAVSPASQQDRYSRDHIVRPRQIMATEQSKGNPCSYKQARSEYGHTRMERLNRLLLPNTIYSLN
jgi:hypothetical protein